MTNRTAEQQQKYDDAICRLVLERNASKFDTDRHVSAGSETAAGTVEEKHMRATERFLSSHGGSPLNTEHVSFRFED